MDKELRPLDSSEVQEVVDGVTEAANAEQPDMLVGRNFTKSLMDFITQWRYIGISPDIIIMSLWVVLHTFIQEKKTWR